MWCKEYIYEVLGASIDQKIDKLFEMLKNIRSADEAVFSDATKIHRGIEFIPTYRARQITGIIVPPSEKSTFGSVGQVQDWIWPLRPCLNPEVSGFLES